MSETKHEPRDTSATSPAQAREPSPTSALVAQLVAAFIDQLRRALEVELPTGSGDDRGPETAALAYVDHYLGLLRDETREPIVSLVAAGAGAWFGELIRREIGGQWIGDGVDPRRLRLLLEPQFAHFSPVDMAYEAILLRSPEPDDPRLPAGVVLDGAYHLRKRVADADAQSDHEWVQDRLAELAPVPEDQFYSLTGRFETLELILELLASRDLARGREPTRYHLNDYIAEIAP